MDCFWLEGADMHQTHQMEVLMEGPDMVQGPISFIEILVRFFFQSESFKYFDFWLFISGFYEDQFTYEEAKKFFGKLQRKNYLDKLGQIPNFHATDLAFGNTLIHAVLESSLLDYGFIIDIMNFLVKHGAKFHQANMYGVYPIHVSIERDASQILTWFLEKDSSIVDTRFGSLPLMHYAVRKYAIHCIKTLHNYNSELINQKIDKFSAPINYCLLELLFKVDAKPEDYGDKSSPYIVQHNPMIKETIDFLLLYGSKYNLYVEKYGSILHLLVKINYFDGIDLLLKPLEIEERTSLMECKDSWQKTSLFVALEKSVNKFKAALMLLDYGANANENIQSEYKALVNDKEEKRTRTISSMSWLCKHANDKANLIPIVEKLLEKVKDFDDAVDSVLDDSSLNFKLLQVVLTEAENRGLNMTELINNGYNPEERTAVHLLAISNHLTDITDEMVFLLGNGANPMIPAHSDKFQDNELPIHIVTSLQYAYDYKDNLNDHGHGDFAKSRLKQYLESFKLFGIKNFLEEKSENYKAQFVKHHLIPAVYAADHDFVYSLMKIFYDLTYTHQEAIIHFRMPNTEDFDYQAFNRTVLFWASHHNQTSILNDIVKAEYQVHRPNLIQSNQESSQRNIMQISGIACFEKLPPTYYKSQAIRTYIDLTNPQQNLWNNVVQAGVDVLLVCYALFILDIYFDVQLIYAYLNEEAKLANVTESDWNETLNITSYNNFRNMSQNEILTLAEMNLQSVLTESQIFLLQKPNIYYISFVLSLCLIVPSLLTYLIVAWFYFIVPESIRDLKWKLCNSKLWFWIISIFNPVIYPCTHFVRYIRAKTYPNSYGKTQRYEDCRRYWMLVRRVEIGVESVGQLILQVWLFGPYFLLIQLWSPKEVFSHIWRGMGYLISLAHLEASFVEIMMGKFIMSTLVTAGSLTILKVSKPTEAGGSFIGSMFYFMATLCQLVARFMTFRLLFLTEIDMLAHFLLILAHIGLELILKLALEFPPWECLTTCSEKFNMMIKALVCSVCGTLVYLGMEKSQAALKAEDNAIKNTFLPFTMHILICIIEQIVLVVIPSVRSGKSWTFMYSPFGFLVLSVLFLTVYYKVFHPASILDTNGPKCCESDKSCYVRSLFCLHVRKLNVPSLCGCEKKSPKETITPTHNGPISPINGSPSVNYSVETQTSTLLMNSGVV